MDLLRQCVDALFQPVDLPLDSFKPFALVDLPPVFEDANRVRLNARYMLVTPLLQGAHAFIQQARRIFHTVQKHDAGNNQNKEHDNFVQASMLNRLYNLGPYFVGYISGKNWSFVMRYL
jgi:hypothetical protein